MKSFRKRWSFHDGPHGSLRRLRNQLAEDGCADSQVVLAKQLLEEKCELEADKISNFKQALDWLICATEQAHPEARRLLRRCIRSGVIEEDSACIVRAKACLAASRQEIVARKAARDLFASISRGEEYITTGQLERRIREICSTQLQKRPDDDDSTDDDAATDEGHALEPSPPEAAGDAGQAGAEEAENGEQAGNGLVRPSPAPCDASEEDDLPEASCAHPIRNLTVEHLVSAAVDYCQGELPPVSRELTLSEPALQALDHIPVLQRALLHPLLLLRVLYLKLLARCGALRPWPSPLQLGLALAALLSLDARTLLALLPLGVYCGSFVAMALCTLQMLHAERRLGDFRKWSGLFLRYSDGDLRPERAERLFVRKQRAPFAGFFAGLLLNLLAAPFARAAWVPWAELCVGAAGLTLLTLASFAPDALALASFAVNVLARCPSEKASLVLSLPRSLPLAAGVELCLEGRALLALLGPALLLALGRRGFWHRLAPHCVTLSWLQLSVSCARGSSGFGLARAALGAACSVLLLPLLSLASVSLPLLALARLLSAPVALLLALALFAALFFAKREAVRKFATPCQLACGCLALLYLGGELAASVREEGLPLSLVELLPADREGLRGLLRGEPADFDEAAFAIGWEEYHEQCARPAWERSSEAAAQAKCRVLEGARVSWRGAVTRVALRSVANAREELARWLPRRLRDLFRCLAGREYAASCDLAPDECAFVAAVARQSGKTCHLADFDEYTFEVTVGMETSGGLLKRHAEVGLVLEHAFANMTRLLRADDRIEFGGTLERGLGLGGRAVSVRVDELRCERCQATEGELRARPASASGLAELLRGAAGDCALAAKHVLNFLFNPVLVFK